MCVFSFIGDHYYDKWTTPPYKNPQIPPHNPNVWPTYIPTPVPPKQITPEELKEFEALLNKARQYDIDNGEPNCETLQKFERIREILIERGIPVPPFLTAKPETIEEIAAAFQKEFASPNLQAVGIGNEEIFVYLKKKSGIKKYPKTYRKVPVHIRIANFKPA